MGKEHYSEESNKAFETAKLTSYWLYLAGIPEAVEYGKLIDLENAIDPGVIPHSKDMCFLNPIIHEIRYGSINHYIRESGCKNILDIACGYSPRGLQFAKNGYHYVGADLPVVAKELAPIAKQTELAGYEYAGVDATNYESLKEAADKLAGPICIVVEGLGMYLSSQDAAAVRRNIARIMHEHEGSVYITTDPGNGYLFFDVITANYPPERMREAFGMLFEMYNWASNGGITMETDKRPLETDAALFKEAGLIAKMCPLLPAGTALSTLKGLASDAAEKIRNAISHPYTFVAVLSDDYKAEDETEQAFSMESRVENDTLIMSVSGRLDTLSSPGLLECFEQNKDRITSVEIDAEGLTYLAASGSRVLHLIRKQLATPDALIIKNLDGDIENQLADDEIIKHL
ncbi:MAG: hypothetical protein IJ608_14910 [Lachnospiraceae bacterium]|nr:hypothetical protein [Lachnospiraceae bacterium]